MNITATQPLTTPEHLTETQESTSTHFFAMLKPFAQSTAPMFQELLAQYQTTVNEPSEQQSALNCDRELLAQHQTTVDEPSEQRSALNCDQELLTQYQTTVDKPSELQSFLGSDEAPDPFAIYQTNLAQASPQPVRWLCEKRVPLAGITLIDGDHGCGKSTLALQIAACVSSGTPLPDGTSTIQGDVILITPHIDANTTQLKLLTSLDADLSHIKILSYIHDPENASHPSGYRPFAFPQDLPRLFEAVDRINAHLIIIDPFIDTLSHDRRWTDQRLGDLLAELNQHLISRNIACLITRNCPAKGGHARPSAIERSERFLRIATSRLLLAPDPIQPDHLLLSHALSRHSALTPTSILQIQPQPDNPDLPHITFLGSHSLQAKDLINYRPDVLHRRLLSQHLLQIITDATDPVPIATLYASSPHSSTFQIHRALSDLLRTDQIQRPQRGLYTLPPTTPEPADKLDYPATTTSSSEITDKLNSFCYNNSLIRIHRQTQSKVD